MPLYKRFTAIFLSLVLFVSMLCVSAAAFSDVTEDMWFAEYVSYVQDHGLFRGIDDTSFGPDTP